MLKFHAKFVYRKNVYKKQLLYQLFSRACRLDTSLNSFDIQAEELVMRCKYAGWLYKLLGAAKRPLELDSVSV